MRGSLPLMLVSRPFVAIALLLMGGIVAARVFAPEFRHALVALGFSVLLLPRRRTRFAGVGLCLLLLGATLYLARYRVASPEDLRIALSGEPELVAVRGRLLETPEVRQFQSGKNEARYSYATLEVTEIQKRKGAWLPATGRMATRLRGELSGDFFQGRSVEVNGVAAHPATAAAPGLFDYRAYLHERRIFHQLKSDRTNDWRLVSFEPLPLTGRFQRWAAVQLQRGIPERDEASEIIAAMTLGLRNSLSGEMSDMFMRTGTLHIVAISGLHVACIAYFFSALVRLGGLPRAMEGVFIIGVVWFYTVATGLQSSAARSAVMATIFMLVWIVRRPTELLNTVAASAALILLIQPEQLFQTSFQLSFSVVLVIALAAGWIERNHPNASVELRHKLLRIDPLLPYERVPRWRKVAKWVLGFAVANVVVSTASWIGSVPLTAYYFNTVTPVSLVANLFAVPLSSVSLAATVVSLLVPWVAPISNYIAWIFMGWTIEVVEFFGSFSLGYFYVPRPGGWFLMAYAAAVAVLFLPALRSGLRRYSSALVVAALSLFWLGSIYLGKPVAQITVLPAAGTPVWVEESGGSGLLIDCSSERDADYLLKRFLRGQGIGSLDNVLITHGDAHVVGGFEMVWKEFAPETVYTSAVRMRSPGYRAAVEMLAKESDRWKKLGSGDELEGWQVLHPAGETRGFPRADDNAVVLRKRVSGWTFLHLSELGEEGQKALLESGAALNADIVIAGMPERGEPLSDALLESIQPKVIILGTAEYPFTAQGSPSLRERLRATGVETYYINEEQAVTITVNPTGCSIRSMRGRRTELQKKAKEAD